LFLFLAQWERALTAIEFVAFFLGLDWLAGLARRATYFSLAIAKET
jgi:hypothetical protein